MEASEAGKNRDTGGNIITNKLGCSKICRLQNRPQLRFPESVLAMRQTKSIRKVAAGSIKFFKFIEVSEANKRQDTSGNIVTNKFCHSKIRRLQNPPQFRFPESVSATRQIKSIRKVGTASITFLRFI